MYLYGIPIMWSVQQHTYVILALNLNVIECGWFERYSNICDEGHLSWSNASPGPKYKFVYILDIFRKKATSINSHFLKHKHYIYNWVSLKIYIELFTKKNIVDCVLHRAIC